MPAYIGNYVIGDSGLPVQLDADAFGPGLVAPAGTPDTGYVYLFGPGSAQVSDTGETSIKAPVLYTMSSKTVIRQQAFPQDCASDVSADAIVIAPSGTPRAGRIYLFCDHKLVGIDPGGDSAIIADVSAELERNRNPFRGLWISPTGGPDAGTVTLIGTDVQVNPDGTVLAKHSADVGERGRILAVVPGGVPQAGSLVIENWKTGELLLESPSHDVTVLMADERVANDMRAVVAPAGLPNAGTIYAGSDKSLFVIAANGEASVLDVMGYYVALETEGPTAGRVVLLNEEPKPMVVNVMDPGRGIVPLATLDDDAEATWKQAFATTTDASGLYWALRALIPTGLNLTTGLGGILYAFDRSGIIAVTEDGTISEIPVS